MMCARCRTTAASSGSAAWTTAIGTIVIVLIFTARIIEGLRLTNMTVPKFVDYRDTMDLDCQFDMGEEELYAVKWYKDELEFFRYIPQQKPNIVLFPVIGVSVREEDTQCGPSRCTLHFAHLEKINSGGAYRCEVSSEAPAFRLASSTLNVTVAAIPGTGPRVEGLEDSYYEGEILNAKCISAPSDPAQEITWYINNEEASSIFVRGTNYTRLPANHPLATAGLRNEIEGGRGRDDNLLSSWQVLKFVPGSLNISSGGTTPGPVRRIHLSCAATLPGGSGLRLFANHSVTFYEAGSQIINQKYYRFSSSTDALRFRIDLLLGLLLVVQIIQIL